MLSFSQLLMRLRFCRKHHFVFVQCCTLRDVPDNLINLKKSQLEAIREQFKQKQSEKIEKLEHDLSGWVQTNEDRFIRDHSSRNQKPYSNFVIFSQSPFLRGFSKTPNRM